MPSHVFHLVISICLFCSLLHYSRRTTCTGRTLAPLYPLAPARRTVKKQFEFSKFFHHLPSRVRHPLARVSIKRRLRGATAKHRSSTMFNAKFKWTSRDFPHILRLDSTPATHDAILAAGTVAAEPPDIFNV